MKTKFFAIAALLSVVSGASFAACAGANNATVGNVGTAAGPALGADTCVCNGLSERNQVNGGTGVQVAVGAAQFIRMGFVMQCSNNTIVSMSDISATQFAAAGASRKGNQIMVGSSAGGSARPSALNNCTGGTGPNDRFCQPADVTTGIGEATAQANGL